MKCAIIIPAWSPEDIFPTRTAGAQINYWQPLGTLYVATAIMKAGNDVRLFNGAFMTHEEILRTVHDYRPEFVGLYATTFGWDRALRTAADIKRILQGVFIAAGGPYPIAMKEECLAGADSVDAIVTGEGEITVVEMLNRLQENESLAGVAGIAYREDGQIRRNPSRPLIRDLDELAFPDRKLLGDTDTYIPPPATYRNRPVAVMMTSRGCDRKCIFCFQMEETRKNGVRYRSVENVLDEIELCRRQGYREIKFIDDTLCADYGRALSLAEGVMSRNLRFSWFASAVVSQVDRRLLRAFKEAGCWAILFGAESGVQKNLNAIRKGITLDQTREAVAMAREAGLTVFTSFMFGIPGETFEEGLRTVDFACALNPHFASFHALTPFPGTPLHDNIDTYGSRSADLADYTYQGAAFVPHTMSRGQIAELRRIALKKFYSRPRFVMNRLLSLRTLHDVRVCATGVKSLFWIWAKKGIFEKTTGCG